MKVYDYSLLGSSTYVAYGAAVYAHCRQHIVFHTTVFLFVSFVGYAMQ